jgi:glycosyltransferase involved in cell wall biosynthesis
MTDPHKRPILIVASALPYEATGTSIVARRLIDNLQEDEAVLLARAPSHRVHLTQRRLPIPSIKVRWLPLGLRGERYWKVGGIIPAVVQGIMAVRRHRCGAILAMFPDELSLPTGYLLHRATGLPLIAYFCDLYLEDRDDRGWEKTIARWVQPRVLRAASRLITLNRGLEEYYRDRHGIVAVTVPTCINKPLAEGGLLAPPANPFRIAFSGNVNDTRIDSLRALVVAVGSDPGYALQYFTPQPPEELKALGVWAPNASAEFVADDASLVRRLSECDVLLLPLTFEVSGHSRDQMATCLGTKLFEYFEAGKPVLVHCPADYYMARYFREAGCGLVVTDPSAAAIRTALKRLREDLALRQDLVNKAFVAAREFEGPKVTALLRREIAAVMANAGTAFEGAS